MKRYAYIIGFVLLLTFVTFLLKDFVRNDLAVPVMQMVRLIDDLPQVFIWTVFIVIILIAANISLNTGNIFGFKFRKEDRAERRGHLEELSHMVEKGSKNAFSRNLLYQYLGDLSIEIFACKERTTTKDIRKRLSSGTIEAPPDIVHFLRAMTLNNGNGYGQNRDSQSSHRTDLELQEIELSHIVSFLEQQLEVFHGTEDQ